MDDALRLVERHFAAGDANLDELVAARQRAGGVRLCLACKGSGSDEAPEPNVGPCWVCEGGRTEEAFEALLLRDMLERE